MRVSFLIALVLSFVVSIQAAAQHSATLSCTPSPTAGVTYNIYRAPNTGTTLTSCPVASTTALPWTKISTGLATCGFVDTSVTAGQQLCYFVTSFLATSNGTTIAGESVPSNLVAASIPKDSVQPPTNLVISQVSLNTTGSKSVVAVNWTAPLSDNVNWTLIDDKNNVLANGLGISDGNMTWGGHKAKSVTFTVCDTSGCASKTV